jgi:hypothetical protein
MLPGSLWNTSPYDDELSVPFDPVPPLAPALTHETFDDGMPVPLGGVNAAASARTLTLRDFPSVRLAFEKFTVVVPEPLVLRVTSLTEKLTAAGTWISTVPPCAAAETTVAAQAMIPKTTIRIVSKGVDRRRLTCITPA